MRNAECSVNFSRTPNPNLLRIRQPFTEGGLKGGGASQRKPRCTSPIPSFSLKIKFLPSLPKAVSLSHSATVTPSWAPSFLSSVCLIRDFCHSSILQPSGTDCEHLAVFCFLLVFLVPVTLAVRLVRWICSGFYNRNVDTFSCHPAGHSRSP